MRAHFICGPFLFIECKRNSSCVFNPYEAQLARENGRSSTSFFSLSVSSEDSPLGVHHLRKLLTQAASRASTLQERSLALPARGLSPPAGPHDRDALRGCITEMRYKTCLRKTIGGEVHAGLTGISCLSLLHLRESSALRTRSADLATTVNSRSVLWQVTQALWTR